MITKQRIPRPFVKKARLRNVRDDIELFLLSFPTLVWYALFCYLPMVGVVIAFKNYRALSGGNFFTNLFSSAWVGMKNFRFLFRTPDAALIFRNTVGYNAVFIVLGVIIPVALAVMITQIYSKRLAKLCQTAIFLPYFFSWVVAGYFIFSFMSYDKGLLNQVRVFLNMEAMNWYAAEAYWPYFLVFLNLWKNVGYAMVVYMAAISGMDGGLLEASLIDGASRGQQVRYITLPLLRPIISIMFIMAVGRIFSSDFGLFYQATRDSGAIANVTLTIDVYVYKALIQRNNIGYASAASLTQSVFGMVTILAANLIVRRIDADSSLF